MSKGRRQNKIKKGRRRKKGAEKKYFTRTIDGFEIDRVHRYMSTVGCVMPGPV